MRLGWDCSECRTEWRRIAAFPPSLKPPLGRAASHGAEETIARLWLEAQNADRCGLSVQHCSEDMHVTYSQQYSMADLACCMQPGLIQLAELPDSPLMSSTASGPEGST